MTDDPIQITRVVSLDADQLDRLNARFGTAWDRAEVAGFLANPDHLLLLAAWAGAPCGFLTGYRLQRLDRRRAEVLLYEIDVRPTFQRRGVGRALVAAVKDWAQEGGADEVWVLTDRTSAAAMAVYQAVGGAPDGETTVLFLIPLAATPPSEPAH